MAVAEGHASPQALSASPSDASRERAWHEVVLQTLKRNDIRLVPYVPDRVLTTLIRNIHADPFFTAFPPARRKPSASSPAPGWAACAARY